MTGYIGHSGSTTQTRPHTSSRIWRNQGPKGQPESRLVVTLD